jgi:hypothetical protein
MVKENYSMGETFLVKVFSDFSNDDQKPTKISSNPHDPKGTQESSSTRQRHLQKEALAHVIGGGEVNSAKSLKDIIEALPATSNKYYGLFYSSHSQD